MRKEDRVRVNREDTRVQEAPSRSKSPSERPGAERVKGSASEPPMKKERQSGKLPLPQ